nr:MAG TPA: hypothetical protein [Bacteriophage sp.]
MLAVHRVKQTMTRDYYIIIYDTEEVKKEWKIKI